MTSRSITSARPARERAPHSKLTESGQDGRRLVVPIARLLFAAIFVMAAPSHFYGPTIALAASHGVPLASVMVPLFGLMALVGGFSVSLGWRTRVGAWLLVLYLIPVTLTMHNFWTVTDAVAASLQQAMFMKNVALLGGALLMAFFGAGPVSLDAHDVFPVFPHQGTNAPAGG